MIKKTLPLVLSFRKAFFKLNWFVVSERISQDLKGQWTRTMQQKKIKRVLFSFFFAFCSMLLFTSPLLCLKQLLSETGTGTIITKFLRAGEHNERAR